MIRKHVNLLFALGIYLFLGIYFLKYYQYQIGNDGIAYIHMAQKYLKGEFINAIRGNWSPLISWLLIPFLAMGIKPLLACKILSLLIGLFTIIGIRFFSLLFDLEEDVRQGVLYSSILPVLWWAYCVISPDLLVVLILIWYFIFIFDENYSKKNYRGLLCGLAGSLGYLAKTYIFYFFLIHFLLLNIVHYLSVSASEKKKVVKNFLLGILIFIVIITPWIISLNKKYHIVTIATVGRYNYYVFILQTKDPPFEQGFIEPFNEGDTSSWDDPSYYQLKSDRHVPSLEHEIDLIYNHINLILNSFMKFSLLSHVITGNIFLLLILYFKEIVCKKKIIMFLLTSLVYPAGYIIIHLEERFILINEVLIILAGGYLLSLLFKDKYIGRLSRKIVLILFIMSFSISFFNQLNHNKYTGKNIYDESKILKEKYNINGKVASDRILWARILEISYYLNLKYYGIPKPDSTFEELKRDFEKYDLDYYFLWDRSDRDLLNELSGHYYKIRDESLPFCIYNLKKPAIKIENK